MFFSTHAEEQGSTGDNYKNLGWSVYSWKDDDDGLVYAQLYDAYGNDVLLFRVNTKEQLEAYGGIDGSSGSWDVVSKTSEILIFWSLIPINSVLFLISLISSS